MKRADFMTSEQKQKMGNLPRTHQNCREKLGYYQGKTFVEGPARPGKTAQDRWRREKGNKS